MRSVILLLLAITVTSCAPAVWVKPGANTADFEVAKGRCLAASYRSISPAMESVPIGGGYTTPMYTNCFGTGFSANCTTTGGQYVPPATMAVDTNQSVRNQVFRGCMYSDGWALQKPEEASTTLADL